MLGYATSYWEKFDRFRADSASYKTEIFDYCDKENTLFTISGQKDKSIMYEIDNIAQESWEVLSPREHIAEFMHTMGEAVTMPLE